MPGEQTSTAPGRSHVVAGVSRERPTMIRRVSFDVLLHERFEVDVARGVPASRLMDEYRLTYQQVRELIEAMNADPSQPRPRQPAGNAFEHGTEQAWRRHRDKQEQPCGMCAQRHSQRLQLRREARRRHDKDKQQRGVA